MLTYVPHTARVVAMEQELLDRDQILKFLQVHLKEGQARMKRIYDAHPQEKEFKEGD